MCHRKPRVFALPQVRSPVVGNFTLPQYCDIEAAYSDGSPTGLCGKYADIPQYCSFDELAVENDPDLYRSAVAYSCNNPGEPCTASETIPGGPGLNDTDFVLYITSKVIPKHSSTRTGNWQQRV